LIPGAFAGAFHFVKIRPCLFQLGMQEIELLLILFFDACPVCTFTHTDNSS
jgi:hypothetical protein